MKMIIKKFFFFLLLILPFRAYLQEAFSTIIFRPDIKTLRIIVRGNELSYPAIELNSDQTILVSFDDLDAVRKNYSYQIIHCNSNWVQSDLFLDEYLDGFSDNPVQDYEFSTNTKVAYINYQVTLPNDEAKFKVSGNYVLKVFENGDADHPVLTACFWVYESLIGVEADVNRPLGYGIQDEDQEVRLTLHTDQFAINDPNNDIKVTICQNNRPDRILKDIKPVFVESDKLVYSNAGDNIFTAGNEFRTFSFTNIHKAGLNVNEIRYIDTIYHVQLRVDESRAAKKYFWDEEMNGKSIINLESGYDPNRSADYAWIYFSLPMDEPFLDGKVYVYGSFNNWAINEKNLMYYNYDKKMYESVILLKQGYYNYIYVLNNNFTRSLDDKAIEGSHYQTENDYIINVYYRGFSDKYDRLVGYRVVNSKYKN